MLNKLVGGSILKKPKMWRQRYIPYEFVDLSNDEVLHRSKKLLITKWEVIHRHTDIQWGISYIYLDKGLKISKHFNKDGEFVKFYCDVMEIEYFEDEDKYIFKDLLLDVMISSGNEMKVLDFDELAQALEEELITKEQAIYSLRKLDDLVKMIYAGQFPPKEINLQWDKY